MPAPTCWCAPWWRRPGPTAHIDAAERQKIQEYLTEQGERMRPAGLTPSSPAPRPPVSWREK